jgi:hypothetical protein
LTEVSKLTTSETTTHRIVGLLLIRDIVNEFASGRVCIVLSKKFPPFNMLFIVLLSFFRPVHSEQLSITTSNAIDPLKRTVFTSCLSSVSFVLFLFPLRFNSVCLIQVTLKLMESALKSQKLEGKLLGLCVTIVELVLNWEFDESTDNVTLAFVFLLFFPLSRFLFPLIRLSPSCRLKLSAVDDNDEEKENSKSITSVKPGAGWTDVLVNSKVPELILSVYNAVGFLLCSEHRLPPLI